MSGVEIGACYVPGWVEDLPRYVRRSVGVLDGLCLHEEPTSKGRWVCVLPAHDGGSHG